MPVFRTLLGWFEGPAALQATGLVARCNQPAKRAHPLRPEIVETPVIRRGSAGFCEPLCDKGECSKHATAKHIQEGLH
jgi:hypothetical protein